MTPRGWIIVALIAIVAVWVCFALLRSPPSPMRTADEKQIERETAEIQGEVWWKRIAAAIGFVVACMLVAAVLVPK